MKNIITNIAQEFATKGIKAYYVGGCVRDSILGITSEDIDICLIGVTDKSVVMEVLSKYAQKVAQEVGENFPVWIAYICGQKVDFALGRAEKRSGATRKDFSVTIEGVSIVDDLRRRDLTINAIAEDCLSGEIIDPFGGQRDLVWRVARAVSEAFAEDPLRVYRLARFCARFGLTPTKNTITLCKSITHTGISAERVGKELSNMFEQALKPSTFFEILRQVGWLKYHFAPVEALVGLEQDPQWHPEGDVFRHSMFTMDAATDPFIRCVMLCHDLGKVTTTEKKGNRIVSPGHASAGVEPTRKMLQGIKFADNQTIERICYLVQMHMIHTEGVIAKKRVMKLMREMEKIQLDYFQLVEVCRCDSSGRPPLPPHTPDIGQGFVEEIILRDENTPIVNGDMLLELGYTQGRALGDKLKEFRQLQDDGKLTKDNWKTFL